MENIHPEQFKHSWSRINDYMTCPFMYKTKHIDKKKIEHSPALTIGSVSHRAIAIYNQHCIDKSLTSDYPKWKKFTMQALEEYNLDPQYYDEVLNLVKSFCDRHELDLESVVGAEEQISITREGKECEWMAEDVWFRSVIDYLQVQGDRAKITDYKSGFLMDVPLFQMFLYAWVLKKIYPHIAVFEVEVDFLRHEYQKDFLIEEDDLAEFEERLFTKINKIEKDTEFKPKVGHACALCGCWRWCPAMNEKDVIYKFPETPKEAEKLALELELATRRKEEANKILKDYCDKAGEVIAGGKLYYFKTSQNWKVEDTNELIVQTDKKDIDIFDAIGVDTKMLNKMMFKDEKLRKIVEKIGKKDVSVKFSSKRFKEGDESGAGK